MKARVIYHSSTGNTKKIAEAIARGAGCVAEAVGSLSGPIEAELLFLGGAVYATQDHDLHPDLKAFIASLDPKKLKRVVLFRTGFADTAISLMRKLLATRGIEADAAHFGCKGRFLLFDFGHPDAEDRRLAEDFARKVAAK